MDRAIAESLLIEAESMNKGAWVDHSYHVAQLAEKIARKARICLTHTFQYQDVEAIYDTWDCSSEEKQFVAEYLRGITYNDYDKLIQLCDALSLANGYCYAEKKMVNSVIKFGFKDTTIPKWKAILELKEYFDKKIQGDVYLLF